MFTFMKMETDMKESGKMEKDMEKVQWIMPVVVNIQECG